MSWCWFALLGADDDPGGATARATAEPLEGGADVRLVCWPAGPRPHPAALRADATAFDSAGTVAQVSLLLLAPARAPLFDDPAVSGAIRRVLSGPAPAAVTTLTRDPVHLAGSAYIVRDGFPRLDEDPFARLGAVRRFAVGPGLFAATPRPAGPVGQRYSGQPWPATGFAA